MLQCAETSSAGSSDSASDGTMLLLAGRRDLSNPSSSSIQASKPLKRSAHPSAGPLPLTLNLRHPRGSSSAHCRQASPAEPTSRCLSCDSLLKATRGRRLETYRLPVSPSPLLRRCSGRLRQHERRRGPDLMTWSHKASTERPPYVSPDDSRRGGMHAHDGMMQQAPRIISAGIMYQTTYVNSR